MTKVNIQKFHILPTVCIPVSVIRFRRSSDYFPLQHYMTGFYDHDVFSAW
jgi:hypothetical protein